MCDFENPTKTYKQYWTTPYCFRPMSSRRVNSVKELNRLMERIEKLEAAKKDLQDVRDDLRERIEELEVWADAAKASQRFARHITGRPDAVVDEVLAEYVVLMNGLRELYKGSVQYQETRSEGLFTHTDPTVYLKVKRDELRALLGDEE